MIESSHVYENTELLDNLALRESLERTAIATTTSETLKKLDVSIDSLPKKCQNILEEAAKAQLELSIEKLDPISISLLLTRENSEKLEDNYELLKLKQKNDELKMKIYRNTLFINEIKEDLALSKNSMSSQNPNPQNIQDYIRQLKQKLNSYEDSCEKAQNKLTVLGVPDAILPKSLMELMTSLVSLREEASVLKQRADEVLLVKEARDTFQRLRR